MWFSGEVHAVMEKFHVHNNVKSSHRRNSIVQRGVGLRVRCNDGIHVRGICVFHHFLVSVPRTFVDYCTNTPGQQAMNYYFECPTKLKTSRGRKRITLPILIDYDILEAAKCHQQLQNKTV